MDQIRSTMIQQEALFKEQVQALHRLYGVQRSAMQEMRKRIYAQPQVLSVKCEDMVLGNDQLQGPVLKGKSLRRVHTSGHSYKEEGLSLSLHPFCASEESRAHDSSWMNRRGVETSNGAQSKFVRDFDLEQIPEDCMDESELNTLNSDQALAGKVCEVDVKKFDAISHNSNSITDEKKMLSNQGSSEFTTPLDLVRLGPERSTKQSKGSKFTVYSDSSTSTISTAHKKLEEVVLKDYVGGFSFTKCPVVSSRVLYESKDQSGFSIISVSSETNSYSGKKSLQSGTLISEVDGQNENSGDDEGIKLEKRDSPSTKVSESNSCSNSRTNMVKPFVAESEEQQELGHEASESESIAAEILLSFVSRSHAEQSKSKNEQDMSIDKKLDIYDRGSKGGGIHESVKWTGSMGRRRTLRRAR